VASLEGDNVAEHAATHRRRDRNKR